jgi:predicted phosphodiesterase
LVIEVTMRVAVLADVHGNLPALEAVLAEVRDAGAGLVVVAGDVLPGPMGAECLAVLESLDTPVRYLSGNGERVTLDAVDRKELTEVPAPYRPAMEWCAATLTDAQVTNVRLWPPTVELAVEGLGHVHCCHATPRSDTEIVTRRTPEERVAPAFLGVSAPLVICGHTHLRMDRSIAGHRVVNPGSVGMPFDEPGAHWLLLHADGPRFVHTRYDLEAAAARIRATAYPDAESFAASYVVKVPGEETILASFGS